MPDAHRLVVPSTVLHSETVSVGRLLDGATFQVPDYQRGYAWSADDQIPKLWHDIRATYNRSFPNDVLVTDPQAHFLGTIVLQTTKGAAPEVIDGQQRLVSLLILLSVLHEFAAQHSDPESLTAPIFGWLCQPVPGARVPRLQLNREHEFFCESFFRRVTRAQRKEYWGNQSPGGAGQRMADAAEYFYDVIAEFVGPMDALNEKRLSQLVTVISDGLLILRLELHRPRMAYRVFETLNDRGLELSQADLIKNELIHVADAQGTRENVRAAWDVMYDKLEPQFERLKLTEFLQLEYASQQADVRREDLFETIQDEIEGPEPKVTSIDYATRIRDEAGRLASFIDGNDDLSGDANRALEDLKNPLNVIYAYPFLLAARDQCDDEDFGKLAVIARNFTLRYFTVGRSGLSAYQKAMTSRARELRKGTDPEDVCLSLRELSPDEVFIEALAEFAPGTNKLGFYLIKQIEDHLSAGEGVQVLDQGPSQHLEHILPKSLGPGWEHVAKDERTPTVTKRLGNLLVLERSINSYIRNKPLSEKMSNAANRDYSHSRLSLPRDIGNYLKDGEWTIDSIIERQRDLAREYGPVVWSLDW